MNYTSRWELKTQDKLLHDLFQVVGRPFPIPPELEESIREAVRLDPSGGEKAFSYVLRSFSRWSVEKLFPPVG